MLLEGSHHAGKVHVCRRDAGIRVYASTPTLPRMFKLGARADGLLRLVNNLYAPLPLRSLMQCPRVMGAARPGVDYIARA